MKVFITGATGFIGSKLAQLLQGLERGDERSVYALARRDPFSSNRVEGVNYVQGDLLDYDRLEKKVVSVQPDIVIHTAALTPVRASFHQDNPYNYGAVNYLGTVNMVRAALKVRGLKQFIHASTTEVYVSKEGVLTEEDQIGGETPYGVSKAAGDFYVQMAGKVWGLPYTILRPCNTFGRPFGLPEEARGYLTEKAIIGMLRGKEVRFDGLPDRRRSFIHVDDHVRGYMTVLGREECIRQVYNVSSGCITSVGELAAVIQKETGFHGRILWNYNPRPYDPPSLCTDGSKVMHLGWTCRPLEESVRLCVDYWRGRVGA